MDVTTLYKNRFGDNELIRKNKVWEILCKHFFSKYISKDDTVLDIAAGNCEFINNIDCKSKIAMDLNPDVSNYAVDCTVYVQSAACMDNIKDESVDVVFCSNVFEHIEKKSDILKILAECMRVLTPKGKLIILQPNIRYVYKQYWDYFDHVTPLTEKSMVEAITMVYPNVKITVAIPQFLPYTTKGHLPSHPFFVWMYLYFPLAWKILGKQAFVVAEK